MVYQPPQKHPSLFLAKFPLPLNCKLSKPPFLGSPHLYWFFVKCDPSLSIYQKSQCNFHFYQEIFLLLFRQHKMVWPFYCPFQDNPSATMWIADKLCIANCYFHSDWSCNTTSQHFLSLLNLALSHPKLVDEILGACDFWFCFYNIHFLFHLA